MAFRPPEPRFWSVSDQWSHSTPGDIPGLLELGYLHQERVLKTAHRTTDTYDATHQMASISLAEAREQNALANHRSQNKNSWGSFHRYDPGMSKHGGSRRQTAMYAPTERHSGFSCNSCAIQLSFRGVTCVAYKMS